MHERRQPLFLLLVLCNNGCVAFVTPHHNMPYLLVTLAIVSAHFGERRFKANNGGCLGWTLRIVGIALFLLA